MKAMPWSLVLWLGGCVVVPEAAPAPEPFSDCRAEDGDDLDIGGVDTAAQAVRVEGDTLFVWVGHGGGCETHTYEICWPDQAFMESDPVQVDLEIFHDANGDTCEAYETVELSFDLTPLKQAWQDSYGATGGTISIHVGGETVTYTFEA